MTILYATPAIVICLFGLIEWYKHRERMKKLDIELKELEIELEEMRQGHE